MHSCLYVGRVEHHRLAPARHRFRYRLFALYLDLAELPELTGRGGVFSGRRFAWASFLRRDQLGDPQQPLDQAVRDLVEQQTGTRPAGPIRLLTQLRYAGYYFSPLNLYYCFDRRGEAVESIVAEVNNTPWGEQHCYVLGDANRTSHRGGLRFAHPKTFHVSPFMGMDVRYQWTLSPPGERLGVGIGAVAADQARFFQASMALARRPLTRHSLRWFLFRYPILTFQIIVAIHYEALRLWLKKCPFYPHPKTQAAGGAKPS
jgi:DUF1365 family protein